ncbi:MAG TPA: ribonuclease P protein component [Candidatus Saccharimonadales bacterium]
MLSFRYRFHGYNSLRFVYKNGSAVRGGILTVKSLENPRRSTPRVAVVVSKKVMKSAVKRNRIRRRLYEVFRHQLPLLKQNSDIVCIVTSAELIQMDFSDLEKLIVEDLTRARLYK